MVLFVIIVLYLIIVFWLLFTFSLWIFYFGLELQWMILLIMFIIDASVHRGLFNYLMLNSIIGIWLMIGILFGSSILYIMSIYGKIGFFPFFLILCFLWYSSSYIFLIFDLINKWAYFGNFLIIIQVTYWFILFNLYSIMLFTKLIVSIKQMLLLSSLLTYLFIICLILVNEYLSSFLIQTFYLITIAVLIIYNIINLLFNCNLCYVLYLLTDLIKLFIIISFMVIILYWLIVFSFFPTTMFLNKFFSLSVLINYEVSIVFNVIFFSQSIYQVCFLRSLCLLFVLF